MNFLRIYQLNIMLFLEGVCAIIAILVLITKHLSRQRKTAILLMELSAALLLFTTRLSLLYDGDTSRLGWWMIRITRFCDFAFSLTILYSLNLYLIDLFTNEGRLSKVPLFLNIVTILLTVGVSLIIITQWTGLFYTIDEANHYVRSKGRIIGYIIPLAVLILQFAGILHYRKHFPKNIRVTLLCFTLIPLVGAFLQ